MKPNWGFILAMLVSTGVWVAAVVQYEVQRKQKDPDFVALIPFWRIYSASLIC